MNLRILILSAVILLIGCNKSEDKDTAPPPAAALKGVNFLPLSFSGEDITEFFTLAQEAGDIVSWAGDWIQLGDSIQAPAVVVGLSTVYDYTPVIIAQFFNQDSLTLLRPLNDSTKQAYLSAAAWFAARYHPAYLGFGLEINLLAETQPSEFDDFAEFFPAVYDTVKYHSPETKVFTAFQLEKMKGLNGGLFGGVNDTTNAQWVLLERFSDADLIAFTSYPDLIYGAPTEIPTDYYSSVRSHVTSPIAFVELGWHSAASPVGWESSEEEQAEFVDRFFTLTAEANLSFAIWSFIYDPLTFEPFNTMGLRQRTTREPKVAWQHWVNAHW